MEYNYAYDWTSTDFDKPSYIWNTVSSERVYATIEDIGDGQSKDSNIPKKQSQLSWKICSVISVITMFTSILLLISVATIVGVVIVYFANKSQTQVQNHNQTLSVDSTAVVPTTTAVTQLSSQNNTTLVLSTVSEVTSQSSTILRFNIKL